MSRRPSICFLSSAHGANDKRVFAKEAITLAQAGYRVVHLCPGQQTPSTRYSVTTVGYTARDGLLARILRLPQLIIRGSRIGADCYHCNEVDSWIAGIVIKLLRGTPVVFDVHEHYADTFAARFPRTTTAAIARTFVTVAMRVLAYATDRIVLAKESLEGEFERARKKCVLVRNYARAAQSAFPMSGERAELRRPTAVHIGLVSRVRGWETMLAALASSAQSALSLHIVGDFNDGSEPAFWARVGELGLGSRVRVDPWMSFEAMFRILQHSSVGLVLFQPGYRNNEFALPHKLFDYMLAEIPVVVPRFAVEVARIVRETKCGILVDPRDPREVARAIDHYVENPVLARRDGRRGRQAVRDKYNWETEAAKLVQMYEELLGGAS